jgi:hypothetical protein
MLLADLSTKKAEKCPILLGTCPRNILLATDKGYYTFLGLIPCSIGASSVNKPIASTCKRS